MKMRNLWLYTLGTAALFFCTGLPAWADYTITVKNDLSIRHEGRMVVQLKSAMQPSHDFNGGNPISPQKIVPESFKMIGPVCWDTISVKPYVALDGCAEPQWTTHSLNKCINNTVTVKRLNCSINLEVK